MIQTKACEAWAARLAARHREDLSPTERAALDAHLATCPACSAVRREYDLLSRHLRALPAVQLLPEQASGFPWLHAAPGYARQRRAKDAWQALLRLPGGTAGKKFGVGIVSLAIVCVLVVVLIQFLGAQGATLETAVRPGAPSESACQLRTSRGATTCQASYTGMFTDSALAGPSPQMSLLLTQRQAGLSGSATLFQPFPGAGTWPLMLGTINSKGAVQFTLSIPSANLMMQFTGNIQPDGGISGSYTTSAYPQQRGTWSVKLSG